MNGASIFEINKKGNSYNDFEEFPDKIYIDTSAWVKAYGSNNTSYGNASMLKTFIGDCSANGVHMYHSGLVLQEVVHANQKAYFDNIIDENNIKTPRYRDGSINRKKLYQMVLDNNPSVVQAIENTTETIIKTVREMSIPLDYIDDYEAFEDTQKIRKATNYLLDTQDARHIYISRSYGINSYLTADGDFTMLDNSNIYVLPHEKYAHAKLSRNNVLQKFDETKY